MFKTWFTYCYCVENFIIIYKKREKHKCKKHANNLFEIR